MQHAHLEQDLFNFSLRSKEMSEVHAPAPVTLPHPAGEAKGVKLPKLDIPTFNASILIWRSFLGTIHHLSA